MFQFKVFFKDYSDNYPTKKEGERQLVSPNPTYTIYIPIPITNSTLFHEGEGAAATSLGGPKGLQIREFKVIHRVPSGEGATATSLGIPKLFYTYKKINRKNAPNELSLNFY